MSEWTYMSALDGLGWEITIPERARFCVGLESDARKIVAAPEMVAVLEWIVDGSWNDGPGSWAVLDRRVEEVLAKVHGENEPAKG